MMKKFLAVILSIAMLMTFVTLSYAESVDRPLQKSKIKVGINAQLPPFEYYDENGDLYGFDIDLMNYIGEKTGLEIEFVDMEFDALIPAVINGKVECAISAISITEERNSVIDYSIPYLSAKVTYLDSGTSNRSNEQYAIVFPNNSSEKGKLAEAAGIPESSVYNLVNKALSELIKDETVEKLGEKYNLNIASGTDAFEYEYTVMPVDDGFDKGNMDKSEMTSDGTHLAPPNDWALNDVKKADELGITQVGINYRYGMSITREEFCELIYNYCGAVGKFIVDNESTPFKDTNNMKVQTLSSMGIIYGKTVDKFAPSDLLTREEAATILFRLIDKVHPDWAAHQVYYEFKDSADISDWAKDSIQIICNMGIMNGIGNNKFAPKDNFTTEQAIVTIVRVYNGFNL